MNPLHLEPDLHLSSNYRLQPDTWQSRCAFGIAARYGNCQMVAESGWGCHLRIKDTKKNASEQKYLEVPDSVLKIHSLGPVGGSNG